MISFSSLSLSLSLSLFLKNSSPPLSVQTLLRFQNYLNDKSFNFYCDVTWRREKKGKSPFLKINRKVKRSPRILIFAIFENFESSEQAQPWGN